MTEAVSYVTDRSPCRPNRRPLHPQPKVIWATMMEDILINHNAEVIRPMSWMIVHICCVGRDAIQPSVDRTDEAHHCAGSRWARGYCDVLQARCDMLPPHVC